uniref:Uncharacterized protein n=1 Tax=Oryza glumipatula TaxID=40148 RepID=A0A0D9ZF83_9ORYZ
MSGVRVAAKAPAAAAAWPYVEYMARWERQVERRQLFLRSYHFSRDVELSPRARARRVVWVGLRRLRRAAATGLRRLRARLRLCFAWVSRRRNIHRRGARFGRYGRFSGGAAHAPAPAASSSMCFW